MERLSQRVEQFIRSGIGDWESLALDIFRHQFELNKPYQAYCQSLGKTPNQVTRWADIPAAPIQAFKSTELVTFRTNHAAAHFESSGTTETRPSHHYLKTLTYYELALKSSFRKHVLTSDTRIPMIIAAPPPGDAPRSSLTWMFEVVKNQWGDTGSSYFVQGGRLNEPRLVHVLQSTVTDGRPVLLLGTTIAWLALFDYMEKTGKSFKLPAGSRLLDTGGMKTSKRLIGRGPFVDLVQAYLGILEWDCINEYGMCELSSQFYGSGKSLALEAPGWVRTTLNDGMLCHYDLANVDSVLAIQTQDLGRLTDTGFELLGRASDAEVKGCSVAAEAFVR